MSVLKTVCSQEDLEDHVVKHFVTKFIHCCLDLHDKLSLEAATKINAVIFFWKNMSLKC